MKLIETVESGLEIFIHTSADGKTIVSTDRVGDALEIFRINPDDKHAQQLTKLGMGATTPTVSYDGKWISFISFSLCDEIYWRNCNTSEKTCREKRAGKRPVWIMGIVGSNPHVIEAARYQAMIDVSRAVWRPK